MMMMMRMMMMMMTLLRALQENVGRVRSIYCNHAGWCIVGVSCVAHVTCCALHVARQCSNALCSATTRPKAAASKSPTPNFNTASLPSTHPNPPAGTAA